VDCALAAVTHLWWTSESGSGLCIASIGHWPWPPRIARYLSNAARSTWNLSSDFWLLFENEKLHANWSRVKPIRFTGATNLLQPPAVGPSCRPDMDLPPARPRVSLCLRPPAQAQRRHSSLLQAAANARSSVSVLLLRAATAIADRSPRHAAPQQRANPDARWLVAAWPMAINTCITLPWPLLSCPAAAGLQIWESSAIYARSSWRREQTNGPWPWVSPWTHFAWCDVRTGSEAPPPPVLAIF